MFFKNVDKIHAVSLYSVFAQQQTNTLKWKKIVFYDEKFSAEFNEFSFFL